MTKGPAVHMYVHMCTHSLQDVHSSAAVCDAKQLGKLWSRAQECAEGCPVDVMFGIELASVHWHEVLKGVAFGHKAMACKVHKCQHTSGILACSPIWGEAAKGGGVEREGSGRRRRER